MKFLIIVLAIHFIGELISNKRKGTGKDDAEEGRDMVFHPAEFPVRYEP